MFLGNWLPIWIFVVICLDRMIVTLFLLSLLLLFLLFLLCRGYEYFYFNIYFLTWFKQDLDQTSRYWNHHWLLLSRDGNRTDRIRFGFKSDGSDSAISTPICLHFHGGAEIIGFINSCGNFYIGRCISYSIHHNRELAHHRTK
jgi:hypothetical protein